MGREDAPETASRRPQGIGDYAAELPMGADAGQADDQASCAANARAEIAAWAKDYNQERPHSSLGYETPAAFAAELHKQWPAPQPIASPALMRNKATRL